MDLGIDLLKPFLALYIDVLQRLEGSARLEVISQIFDGVLYLALGLITIGITEPDDDAIVLGEAHELAVGRRIWALSFLSMTTCFMMS